MNYAPPDQSPACQCRQRSPVAPTLCGGGHLLECHWPLNCEQSNCSHYPRYLEETIPPDVMEQRDAHARRTLAALADSSCEKCQGEGCFETTTSIDAPGLEHITGSRTLEFSSTAVCLCVRTNTIAQAR